MAETESMLADSQIQNAEVKLNRLLDGYLDQVVEPEIYKQKKNVIFDEKTEARGEKITNF